MMKIVHILKQKCKSKRCIVIALACGVLLLSFCGGVYLWRDFSVQHAEVSENLYRTLDSLESEMRLSQERNMPDLEVVDDCVNYLAESLRQGAENPRKAVERLERFLNAVEGENLSVDGEYGDDDVRAVERFQEKYREEILTPWNLADPTGIVYKTTREKINQLYCAYERLTDRGVIE